MKFPATTRRVAEHTDEDVNRRIMTDLEHRLSYYYLHPEKIDLRLEELDQEWDMERALESNAATLALVGLLLGAAVGKKFLLFPAIVTGFLLQHALQGWCPPVPLFRRLGFRTQSEIELERYALKAVRGDFGAVQRTEGESALGEYPDQVLRSVNM